MGRIPQMINLTHDYKKHKTLPQGTYVLAFPAGAFTFDRGVNKWDNHKREYKIVTASKLSHFE